MEAIKNILKEEVFYMTKIYLYKKSVQNAFVKAIKL